MKLMVGVVLKLHQAIFSCFQDLFDHAPKPAASVAPPYSPPNANGPSKRQTNYFYVLARKAQIEHPSKWLQDFGLPKSPADCSMGQLSQVIERLMGEDRTPSSGCALRKNSRKRSNEKQEGEPRC